MSDNCPHCATYRSLVASDARVMAAQVDLLRALLIGINQQAESIAFIKASIEKAIALADRGGQIVQVVSQPPAIIQ